MQDILNTSASAPLSITTLLINLAVGAVLSILIRWHFKTFGSTLSVGEQSTLTATGISIEQVGTAAVSKDNSHLILKNAKINQVKTPALMAYTKKKEYGPGTIVASQLEMQSILNPAVAQKGSRISIDGKDIEQTDLNVKELYSTLTKSVINK